MKDTFFQMYVVVLSGRMQLLTRVECVQLVEFCEKAANQGKVVIVASLDGSYLREPFKEVMDLIPKAENVTKLTAVCASCAADAAFTLRKTTEKALHVVGGADKYQPMCRACYMKAVTS